MIALVIFVAIICSIIPIYVLRGWVLSWLWLWFMVPLGLPAIGVAWACGLACFASLLSSEKKPEDGKSADAGELLKKIGKAYANIICSPLVALFVGWIVHGFMVS